MFREAIQTFYVILCFTVKEKFDVGILIIFFFFEQNLI